MLLKTTQPHRHGRLVTFPEPIGNLLFDANGHVEVADDKAPLLLEGEYHIVSAEEGAELISDAVGLPTDVEDETSAFDVEEEVKRLKTLNLQELKDTAGEMGIAAVEFADLSSKQDVISLIVKNLQAE
jgi:hypothetical protein